ncbi:MAG: beta-N-acetylhexosaminidase [Chitinophagaceae bacterium]|jgi:hexosaminidase|nr:beta-N-acetylhexosaminidase [Chitinophagaceae bacterium]
MQMKQLFITCFAIVSSVLAIHAQDVNIIPKPLSVETKDGIFSISSSTKLFFFDKKLEKSANYLNAYLRKYYGISLATGKDAPGKNTIVLRLAQQDDPSNTGAYKLEVKESGVDISGNTDTAVFYGIQTLIQLLPTDKTEWNKWLNIPQVNIKDEPRFGYRGAMLDVGRNFEPVDFIERYIDLLALHKLNTFHWHLTDDQGWRIEIKKYPLLTQVGGCRNGTIIGHHPGTGNDNQKVCGYYTQAQVKQIVKYAAERYITVIPEIELPGHSSAAIAAYPQLSCFPDEPTEIKKGVEWAGSKEGKQVQQSWGVYPDVYAPTEYTFNFLQDVFNEIIPLFPSKYIHIGGDECPKDYWKRSEFCQNLIKEKGLKDEHGLQSYFVGRIEKYLNSKGKNIIGWDEILEGGLAPNATVMSWRGIKGGIEAAKQKHNVVMTPTSNVYIDYSQLANEDSLTIGGYLPIQKVYSYEPVPEELAPDEQKYVLGTQVNLWTEYVRNPAKVEYMAFPRLAALSEVAWTKKESKNYTDFKNRLQTELLRYKMWKVNYCEKWDNQPDKK